MRYIFLVLFFTYSCFASTNFWEDITKIESKFYLLDSNSTINEKDINLYIDEKYDKFSRAVETIKHRPYSLNKKNNFFIEDFDKEKMKLLQKIKINKQYGYKLAVKRDNL